MGGVEGYNIGSSEDLYGDGGSTVEEEAVKLGLVGRVSKVDGRGVAGAGNLDDTQSSNSVLTNARMDREGVSESNELSMCSEGSSNLGVRLRLAARHEGQTGARSYTPHADV